MTLFEGSVKEVVLVNKIIVDAPDAEKALQTAEYLHKGNHLEFSGPTEYLGPAPISE